MPSTTRLTLDTTLLADIALGIADARSLWAPLAHHDDECRRPERLLATEDYEVWVIGWTPGQGVDLHDHGDAAGALVVTEGELVEVTARTGRLHRSVLRPGGLRLLPVGLVHDVLNLSNGPATSVHVYSPPLTRMTRYDPVTLEPVGTDAVEQGAPRLSAAPSHVLHPAAADARS